MSHTPSASRPVNFSPGPAILPLPVLEEASRAVSALDGPGLSILEISHRSPTFAAIAAETEATLRRILSVPDSHRILFLQGGARGQFAMVPTNFLRPGQTACYVDTGNWSTGALAEAQRIGEAVEIAGSKGDGYSSLPDLGGVDLPDDVAYVHTTSNNTIYGTQWQTLPSFPGHRHVCDMSSDFLSRPVDVADFGLIYAGAQKNAGPAGVTIVIVDEAWMAEARSDVPAIWDYRVHAGKDSMYNTPPVFPIYVVGLVARWVEEQGGVAAMADRAARKAGLIYEALGRRPELYRPTVPDPAHRSRMNVTWRLSTEELEARFIAQAAERGLVSIKGHRKVGGIRASIYNALPVEGVERLVELIDHFS